MRTLIFALSTSMIVCIVPVATGQDGTHESLARELTQLRLEAGREVMTCPPGLSQFL